MKVVRLVAAGTVAGLIAIAVFAAAPGASAQQAGGGELYLRGAGATFPAPLYKKWIEVYQAKNPNVAISYDAVGSGEGVTRFVTGSVDFGASDYRLADKDAAKVAGGVVVVPATAGMVVLAYNLPGVQGDLKLPRAVYGDIFAGKITSWNDDAIQKANPGLKLPHLDIAKVARQDSSGTTFAFTSHLQAVSEAWRQAGLGAGNLIDWRGSTMLARGNEGIASRVKISEGSIGYMEYGFAKRLGLPVAALQNQAGAFVRPTEQAGQVALAEAAPPSDDAAGLTIADPKGADAYPIVTYSWLLLYKQYGDPRKSAAVKDFIGFGLAGGQDLGVPFGYIPLPQDVAARGQEALAGIR